MHASSYLFNCKCSAAVYRRGSRDGEDTSIRKVHLKKKTCCIFFLLLLGVSKLCIRTVLSSFSSFSSIIYFHNNFLLWMLPLTTIAYTLLKLPFDLSSTKISKFSTNGEYRGVWKKISFLHQKCLGCHWYSKQKPKVTSSKHLIVRNSTFPPLSLNLNKYVSL